MSEREGPLKALCDLIDAINSGKKGDGLKSMTGDVVIVDDVPPFRRSGLEEAELWFRRLAVARERVNASFRLGSADVRLEGDRAYIVAPGLFTGMLDGAEVDVSGTLTATLIECRGAWLVDGLVWSAKP